MPNSTLMRPVADSSMNCLSFLNQYGFLEIKPEYTKCTISRINSLLDPLFKEKSNQARSYVRADELCQLGILKDIFTPSIRRFISESIPNAVFYHCHAYEIEGGRFQSHIHPGPNLGWHRDEECVQHYRSTHPVQVSMFVYLSDVGIDNGMFEFRAKSPFSSLIPGEKTIQILGSAGTTFFFNRSFFHRACPNRSNVRRRVIKFSFQPITLENPRILLDEFKNAQPWVADDPFLTYLFGQYYGHSDPPNIPFPVSLSGRMPIIQTGQATSRLSISWPTLVKMNMLTTLRRFKPGYVTYQARKEDY